MKEPRAPRPRKTRASASARAPSGNGTSEAKPREAETSLPGGDERAHFEALVRGFDVGMLTTHRTDGALVTRPMYIAGFDDDGTVWLITSTDSPIVAEVSADRHVSLSMQGRMRFVSIHATAEAVDDREQLAARWKPTYRVWFPNGPRDAHAVLLKLNPLEAEYWDQSGTYGVRLAISAARALIRRRSIAESSMLGHGRFKLSTTEPRA